MYLVGNALDRMPLSSSHIGGMYRLWFEVQYWKGGTE